MAKVGQELLRQPTDVIHRPMNAITQLPIGIYRHFAIRFYTLRAPPPTTHSEDVVIHSISNYCSISDVDAATPRPK